MTTTPSTRLPKYERAPKLAPRIQLTDRDRAVLYDLFHLRALPLSLIQRRHFGSATRARERLRLLWHHSYVDRTFLPTVGPATGEAIYSLGVASIPELSVIYGLEPAEIRRRRGKIEPLFLQHELLIARFRIAIGIAGSPKGVVIKDWQDGEAAKLRVPARGPDGSESERPITPDGMGWIASKKVRFAFCLEADRGTMTVGRVKTKFERYSRARSAVRGVLGADRFRVLVVAPTERRLASLRAAAEDIGTPNVWLTHEAVVDAEDLDVVVDPVWQRAGVDGRFGLFTNDQLGGAEAPAGVEESPNPKEASHG